MVREIRGIVNKLLAVRDLFDCPKQGLAFVFRILVLYMDHFDKLPSKFMVSFRGAVEDQLATRLQFMKFLLFDALPGEELRPRSTGKANEHGTRVSH